MTDFIGVMVLFTCQHSNADILGWVINGLPYKDQNYSSDCSIEEDMRNGILELSVIAQTGQCNNTYVRCNARNMSSMPTVSSNTGVLIIQGIQKLPT